jgi:hypothetical protein
MADETGKDAMRRLLERRSGSTATGAKTPGGALRAGPPVLLVRGEPVALTVRVDSRLKAPRLRVRMDGTVILSVRTERALKSALAFARSQEDWLAARLAELPARTGFAAGATIPFEGRTVRIEHDPLRRGGVRVEGDLLIVSGDTAHVPRRVADFLKAEARRRLADRAVAHAAQFGVRARRVQVRDTVSRWGSCSSSGTLSFSWRLILAPPEVLDYVAAHEVVHLRFMHHGPAFWDGVASLVPDYRKHERWLKVNGPSLHAYG